MKKSVEKPYQRYQRYQRFNVPFYYSLNVQTQKNVYLAIIYQFQLMILVKFIPEFSLFEIFLCSTTTEVHINTQ